MVIISGIPVLRSFYSTFFHSSEVFHRPVPFTEKHVFSESDFSSKITFSSIQNSNKRNNCLKSILMQD